MTLKDPHIKDVVINQFQASDLILMSKSQLSDKEKQQRTLNLINEIAPEKPVVDLADTPNVKELLLNFYPTTDRSSDNCDHHDHHQIFRSWSIKFDTSLATADVKTLFSQLPSQILRAKGLFRCRNDGLLYEIHRVGVRVDIQRKIENENSGDAAKFVIIGLNQSDFEKTTNILKAIFKSCHVNP
ncbi:GTP-binding protein [Sneathiella glossodoripedis]|uniref:GTP-binding protein n=1 Tax=Sneathiella glossodoripedis TaxID=418853 RepID=UPI0011DD5D79|nr:GTP-binding protein [Sneathiella glossodoripedis]